VAMPQEVLPDPSARRLTGRIVTRIPTVRTRGTSSRTATITGRTRSNRSTTRAAAFVVAVGRDHDVAVLLGLVGDALIADHLTRVAAEAVEENDQWRRLRGVAACRDEERVLDKGVVLVR